MRYEEEVKPIQSINSWTETKVPSTMWEEQKDCDLLFQEVKQVRESSSLRGIPCHEIIAIHFGKKNMNLFGFPRLLSDNKGIRFRMYREIGIVKVVRNMDFR